MLCRLMIQKNLPPQPMFKSPVNVYQTTRPHMPEDCYLHSYTCKNLKSFKAMDPCFHKMSYLNNNCPAPQFSLALLYNAVSGFYLTALRSRMNNWEEFLTSEVQVPLVNSNSLVQINFPENLQYSQFKSSYYITGMGEKTNINNCKISHYCELNNGPNTVERQTRI